MQLEYVKIPTTSTVVVALANPRWQRDLCQHKGVDGWAGVITSPYFRIRRVVQAASKEAWYNLSLSFNNTR